MTNLTEEGIKYSPINNIKIQWIKIHKNPINKNKVNTFNILSYFFVYVLLLKNSFMFLTIQRVYSIIKIYT